MEMKKNKVFIIEDNPTDISLILESMGDDYDISVYTDGESALSAMQTECPSLVLLDVMLPGMGGFEICRLMKGTAVTREIPIIFLTSMTKNIHEKKSLLLGAADFIRKPIEPEILRRRVQNQMYILSQTSFQRMQTSSLLYLKECETIQNMSVLLLKSMDQQTGEHIEKTRDLFYLLAEAYAAKFPDLLSPDEIETMARASTLHDIGKVGIPSHILTKKGSLTSEEITQVQQHTSIGASVIESLEFKLGKNSFLKHAREMALFHHEKWDGTGYPKGLRGEEIPVSARIMALVDVYEALTGVRSYRAGLSTEAACRIITEGDGRTKQGDFDPEVLKVFVSLQSRFS